MTDYDRLGGEEGLSALALAFVHRMAEDFVIGFQFQGRDLARVAHHEAELAAAHLGGPRAYGGRPLGAVHAPLRIQRGQFQRRLHLLRLVLREHGAPDDVIERWCAHDASLEDVVASADDCGPPDQIRSDSVRRSR